MRVDGRHQGQRVVGGGGRAQSGEGDAVRGGARGAESFAVDRVGLEDEQRVEEGLPAEGLLDLGEPEVVVVQEAGLPVLEPGEDVGEGVAGGVRDAHGKGVDEHPDHRVHVRHGGRAAGDGGAEHHVPAAGEPAEEQRPGALDQGVDGDAQLGGAGREGARLLGREVHVELGDALFADALGAGGEQGGLVGPVEFGGPRPQGLLGVLPGAPGQEGVEAGGRGQGGGVAAGAVEQQQVPHQQGRGPAVEQDVVGGHHEFGAAGFHHDQGEAEQGRGVQVEVGGPVLGEEPFELLGAYGFPRSGQV